MKKEIQESEAAAVEAENERDACLKLIGNLVHDSVPVSDDEVTLLSHHCHITICLLPGKQQNLAHFRRIEARSRSAQTHPLRSHPRSGHRQFGGSKQSVRVTSILLNQ